MSAERCRRGRLRGLAPRTKMPAYHLQKPICDGGPGEYRRWGRRAKKHVPITWLLRPRIAGWIGIVAGCVQSQSIGDYVLASALYAPATGIWIGCSAVPCRTAGAEPLQERPLAGDGAKR